jgi:hypothetical protein
MNDGYRVGDVIEATMGENTIRGTVIYEDGFALKVPELDWVGGRARYLHWLDSHGWTLRIVHRGPPPLRPGVYLPSLYDGSTEGRLPNLWVLTPLGKWWCIGNTWGTPPFEMKNGPEEMDGIVRLEAESITAEKITNEIIARIEKEIWERPGWYTKGTAGTIIDWVRELRDSYAKAG